MILIMLNLFLFVKNVKQIYLLKKKIKHSEYEKFDIVRLKIDDVNNYDNKINSLKNIIKEVIDYLKN